MNTLENLLRFADQWISLFSFGMLFVGALFFGYWFYNRKKYHKLAHQIPAAVVKDYLDSIIQNSSALKSSLFRGGGEGHSAPTPSVFPVNQMNTSHVNQEELNQKISLIASLESELKDKGNIIAELEGKVQDLQSRPVESSGEGGIDPETHNQVKGENEELKKKVAELESQLSQAGSGGDAAGEVAAISKERDELKERLQEYEIIEDDLANLKRLQQENEQLKKALESAGGSAPAPAPQEAAPAAEAPEPAQEAAPEKSAEEEPQAEKEESKEEAPELQEGGKSAEDLLSEFEKMLG